MERSKKVLIFSIILLIAVSIALLLFYFFYKKESGLPGEFPITEPGTTPGGGQTGGGGETSGGGGEGGETHGGGGTSLTFKPILRQITTTPSAGGIVFERNGKSYVRYVERGKGHVYETEATTIKATRLSNTTIPQIYEALWKKTGGSVIARRLKDAEKIETFDAVVSPRANGEGELQGEFLTPDIKNLVVSPSGNQIFYLLNTASGVSGILASFDGRNKIQIFDSPLREWLPSWQKENTVMVTSKAGASVPGTSLAIETNSGKQMPLLSNIKGLTALSNSDLSKILYSISSGNSVQTKILSVENRTSSVFPLQTLPEKCVWSRTKKDVIYCSVPENIISGKYPDGWYQGTMSFRDEIWKIDTSLNKIEFLMNLSDQSKEDFDTINLSLNDKENFILLTNKNNLTLWELQIAQ